MTAQQRRAKKRDAFERLATQRTNTVLQRLRILGNCANRQLYEYDEADIRKIFRAIEMEVKATKGKFVGSREPRFKL